LKELGNFSFSHVHWVALIVKEDKPLDPMNVGFFGPVAVVARPNRLVDLVKQLRFRRRCGYAGRWYWLIYRDAIGVQSGYFGSFHVVSSYH
jgi:hypothetical protein